MNWHGTNIDTKPMLPWTWEYVSKTPGVYIPLDHPAIRILVFSKTSEGHDFFRIEHNGRITPYSHHAPSCHYHFVPSPDPLVLTYDSRPSFGFPVTNWEGRATLGVATK